VFVFTILCELKQWRYSGYFLMIYGLSVYKSPSFLYSVPHAGEGQPPCLSFVLCGQILPDVMEVTFL